MNKRQLIMSAFAAAVAGPVIGSGAQAQTPAPTPQFAAEKCYGIARAGKNDCASTGNNSCGGTSRRDNDPRAWVYVPQGLCERIVGASLQPRG
jgi:uncharacterized membrane protein